MIGLGILRTAPKQDRKTLPSPSPITLPVSSVSYRVEHYTHTPLLLVVRVGSDRLGRVFVKSLEHGLQYAQVVMDSAVL